MKIYDYFFYRLYKRTRKTNTDETYCVMTASLLIGLFSFFNLLTIISFLNLNSIVNTKIVVVTILLAFSGLNFLFFLRKKRYKIIEEKYATESKKQNTIGTIGVFAYIILTLILFLIGANYK